MKRNDNLYLSCASVHIFSNFKEFVMIWNDEKYVLEIGCYIITFGGPCEKKVVLFRISKSYCLKTTFGKVRKTSIKMLNDLGIYRPL